MSTSVLAKLRNGSDTTSSAAKMASIASPFPATEGVVVRGHQWRIPSTPSPKP